jgi:hypothetical protein
MRNLLDNPVVDYLTISVCSLLVALICFILGGSLADVSGTSKALGVTYSASGALAGFFIVFVLSQKALARFRREAAARRETQTIPVKVYVQTNPNFDPPATKYRCEATFVNEETGETRTFTTAPRFEAGFLTVYFANVTSADFLGAMISDDRNRQWVLQDFKPFTQTREAIPLLNS